MKIIPRKPTDKAGYLMMPLMANIPKPADITWKKTSCPSCGKECWDRPIPEGFRKGSFDGKLCTMCALQIVGKKGKR